MSQEFHELVVAEVVKETADSRSFVLSVPHGLRERFRYAAGQFVTLELPWEGFAVRRCYSLSSAPGVDAAPQISVKRVPGGRVSNWLIDRVRPGDRLRVSIPEGRFVLTPEDTDRRLSLFAAGSGITPILSLLKAALHQSGRTVSLLYANRDADSVMFDRTLEALEARFPERLTRVSHLDDKGGVLDPETLDAFVAEARDGSHYVCGPEGFMDAVEAALERARVAPTQIRFERFVSPVDPDRKTEAATDDTSGEWPESFLVRLGGRDHHVPLTRGQTLLEAARAAGLKAPSSCESGYCGSCMAQCMRGDVAMQSRQALTDRNLEQGRVLLCQAVPTSDAALEVDCDATSFRIVTATAEDPQWLVRRAVGLLLAVFLTAAVWVLRTRG